MTLADEHEHDRIGTGTTSTTTPHPLRQGARAGRHIETLTVPVIRTTFKTDPVKSDLTKRPEPRRDRDQPSIAQLVAARRRSTVRPVHTLSLVPRIFRGAVVPLFRRRRRRRLSAVPALLLYERERPLHFALTILPSMLHSTSLEG